MSQPLPTIQGVDLSRLYRATVDAISVNGYMRVAFIEADNPDAARLKIAAVFSVIDGCTLQQAEGLVCNVRSAETMLKDGFSEDPLHRLFEIRGAQLYAHPIFLLAKPGDLTKKWAERMALT